MRANMRPQKFVLYSRCLFSTNLRSAPLPFTVVCADVRGEKRRRGRAAVRILQTAVEERLERVHDAIRERAV